MNRRLALKRALLATGRITKPVTVPGLFDATGSIAMAVGVLRPRVLVDPRAYGEDRTLREFALWHESAHIVCGHLPLLFAFRWLGVVFMAGVFALAGALTRSIPVACVLGMLGAWFEARYGWMTLYIRARAETQADGLALAVMQTHAFAAAVKTMTLIQEPARGLDGIVERAVYGAGWRDRLARQGLAVDE